MDLHEQRQQRLRLTIKQPKSESPPALYHPTYFLSNRAFKIILSKINNYSHLTNNRQTHNTNQHAPTERPRRPHAHRMTCHSSGAFSSAAVSSPNSSGAMYYTQELIEAADALKVLSRQRDVSAAEEEGGWDMCLRTIQSGREVHANDVSVVVDVTEFPALFIQYFAKSRLPVLNPSYTLAGDFATHWNAFIRETHPTSAHKGQYLLRVIWDAFCCNGCGFSNEIVHFVNPLQRLFIVNTL